MRLPHVLVADCVCDTLLSAVGLPQCCVCVYVDVAGQLGKPALIPQ